MRPDLGSTIEEVVNTFPGVTLYDFYFNEHSRTLRVYIDAPDGVDIELCARVSASLSSRLDEADPIAGNYRLEVSSPGIERLLRKPEHYEWARGHLVKVVAGDSCVVGTLLDTDAAGIRIQTDGRLVRLAYSEIRRARVVEPALAKGGRA